MSWAGKLPLSHKIRSLFHIKEQAPSSHSSKRQRSRVRVLEEKDYARLDQAVQQWVDAKAYRLPDPTIEAVAGRMGVDSAQLFHYCLEKLGKDFRSWRRELRVEDAKVLLREEPQTSIATIGRRVGFNDRSNFAKQFRSTTGYLPSEWRAQLLG